MPVETPYEANPQVAEIKRLEEALAAEKKANAWGAERLASCQEQLRGLKADYEATWELNTLKAVLRAIIVLIWFALTLGLLFAPWWLCLKLHMSPDYFWLLGPGLLLGIPLWFYLHPESAR